MCRIHCPFHFNRSLNISKSEKQPDGTFLLSLHDSLPPEHAKIAVFGGRSAKLLARFLLRRINEGAHIQATEDTIRRAQSLLD